MECMLCGTGSAVIENGKVYVLTCGLCLGGLCNNCHHSCGCGKRFCDDCSGTVCEECDVLRCSRCNTVSYRESDGKNVCSDCRN